MKKQEIEGQLELDLITGTVKETQKKKTVTKKNKKIKTDISVNQNDIPKKNEDQTASVEEVEQPVQKEKHLSKSQPEEGIFSPTGEPATKKEIVPEVLNRIEEHLAAVGSIHVGTIMRICRISAMEAIVYYETLLTSGIINVKGRTTEKRVWTKRSEKEEFC